MTVITIYALGWFILMVVGILNGALRVTTYAKVMPEIRAHQLSTLTGIILVWLAVYGMDRFWPIQSPNQAWSIGIIWLLMTISFELVFGRFVMKHPWEKLINDYRLDRGRTWSVFLLWVLLCPVVIQTY